MNAAEFSMDDLLWFLRVAQAGSLSSAAVQTGVPKSTLSRRLTRMESSLGTSLVQRNSRSFRLTDVGARLVEQATPLIQQLEQTTADLLSNDAPARGTVRFSASGSFGKLVLVPIVSNYLLENPGVRIEAELTDRRVNIIKEGFDFAVRIGDLPDSGLRVRRLGKVSRVLCASPAYLAAHGTPAKPEDLAQHSCLVQSKGSASIELQGASRSVSVVLPARLISGPSDILLVPVLMGLGISALPEIQVAGHLRRRELVRVLPDWDMPAFEVQILYGAKRLPPATRALMEYFATRIPAAIAALLGG
jgi:DNA-binding transcriptional LysR family regulator